MRNLLSVVLSLLAVPLAIAQAPPRLLAGAQTVFINAAPPALQEIEAALLAEVPSLCFVSTLKEADVMIELRVRFTWTGARTTKPEISHRDRYARLYVSYGKTASRPMLVMDGVAGMVVRGKEEQMVYRAGSTPTVIEEFARSFGKAWREANP